MILNHKQREMIKEYMDFAEGIAKRVVIPQKVDRADIITVGYHALIEAVSRYDGRNIKVFEGYLAGIVKNRIKDYLRDRGRWIRNWKKKELRRRKIYISTSEVMAFDDGHEVTLGDMLADKRKLFDGVIIDKIVANKLLEVLTKKEKMVISEYYFNEKTLKIISKRLKVTESRVSQIHRQALNKMREEYNERERA